MNLTQGLLLAGAGLAAGAINSIAGAGTLLTFPTLLALGLPPLQANVSNSIGLVPGSLSGAWGYRRHLGGQRAIILPLLAPAAVGALVGAGLLLILPARWFEVVVPGLVALAAVLVLAQPRISRAIAGRGHGGPALPVGLFLVGVYGGYFGAAQGILLLAVMGVLMTAPLQRINGFKTLLAGTANAVSGLLFVVLAPVSWPHALVLAASSLAGGVVGAALAQRVPELPLRLVIGAFGLVVAARLALQYHVT